MKLNWGKGIAILYISFVGFMLFMVIQSSRHDLNLVTKDYYEKDLNYEDHRIKQINTRALEKNVEISHSPESETITFQFPEVGRLVEGTILFFRPSDGKQDKSLAIQPDQTNLMKVSTDNLTSGHWRVQVDWSDGQKGYYTEATLIL